MTFKHIGSVSSGTLRSEDLLPAFADLLEMICDENPRPADAQPDVIYMGCDSDAHRNLIDEARAVDTDNDSVIVGDLLDALTEFAPDYFYFGAHPSDGADFGFWLHEDWQQMMEDDCVVIVADLSHAPETPWEGSIAVVTDHGNVSYGYVEGGEFVEIWSVV
jgi:hypothetical protein